MFSEVEKMKVKVWIKGKIVEVEPCCRVCGSRLGEVVRGSLHVYFKCAWCRMWSDLGLMVFSGTGGS